MSRRFHCRLPQGPAQESQIRAIFVIRERFAGLEPATFLRTNVRCKMSKIPKLTTEQEEAEFWATHDSTDFAEDTEAVDVTFVDSRPPKKQIALRLDGDTIDALKAVASRKGIGYQTLIRLWVNERLEQEQAGVSRS